MNRHRKDMDQLVETHLGLFDSPPLEEMDSSLDRTLGRLRSRGADPARRHVEKTVPARSGGRWRIVAAAAAVVLTVGIGIIWRHDAALATTVGGGSLSRVIGADTRALEQGARITSGETVHAVTDGAALRLADGSGIEMRSKAELTLEPVEDGVRIVLNKGSVIVNAARQPAGRHLYVRTKDVTVAVVGTVFLVNAEEEGSRVAVIEGEVRVEQGSTEKSLGPGEQMATNPSLEKQLVVEEIAWSPKAEKHLAMLQQNEASRAPAAAQPATRPADTPKWEAISIRPCATGIEPGARGGGTSGETPGGAVGIKPGLLRVICMPVQYLIEDAYVKYLEPEVLRRRWVYPVTGGPSWLDTDLYSIEATPEAPVSRQMMGGPMLQVLLEDRFRLKIRREVREEPVYELRVADTGFKLQPLPDGECEARKIQPTDGPPQDRIEALLDVLAVSVRSGKPVCGSVFFGPMDGSSTIPGTKTVSMGGMTLTDLTMYVRLDRLILDKTGIQGLFDLSLTYGMYNSPLREPPPPPTEPPGGESIFKAIEKQLGLKLVPAMGPRTYYVIDHVERPSEN